VSRSDDRPARFARYGADDARGPWLDPTAGGTKWRDTIYEGLDDIYCLERSSGANTPTAGGTFALRAEVVLGSVSELMPETVAARLTVVPISQIRARVSAMGRHGGRECG
jgi:hypothetical protein